MRIHPTAVIDPTAELGPDVEIGPYCVVGPNVNIGAGTITANYDGKRKNRTVIGNGAFIGSDTILRAPITVGEGAYTGAGSVVTRDVPPGKLAVGVPARIRERLTHE